MLKNKNWILASLLILSSLGVAIFFIIIAAERTLTQLENVLLQIIILALGLLGSFLFGQISAKNIAKDIIKPHARSAFRRLLSLFNSLSRLATTIEYAKSTDIISQKENAAILDKLSAIVTEQIATADDALEDWKDIVPEEVEQIRTKIDEIAKKGVRNG